MYRPGHLTRSPDFLISSAPFVYQTQQYTSSMPPRVPISRLPRLTLFTGGPECGLCEVSRELRNADHANFQVALDYLDLVYETHPFDLELFNIRDPPKEADPMEANKWKRMYQYDIVSGRRQTSESVAQLTPAARASP